MINYLCIHDYVSGQTKVLARYGNVENCRFLLDTTLLDSQNLIQGDAPFHQSFNLSDISLISAGMFCLRFRDDIDRLTVYRKRKLAGYLYNSWSIEKIYDLFIVTDTVPERPRGVSEEPDRDLFKPVLDQLIQKRPIYDA